MEKIELKHLAPYLPYGLKIEARIVKFPDFSSRILNGYLYEDFKLGDIEIIPILRPLSDLIKAIPFVPMSELFDVCFESLYGLGSEDMLSDFIACEDHGDRYLFHVRGIEDNDFEYALWLHLDKLWFSFEVNNANMMVPQLKIFEKLFELHIDVFGLIEAGLAIDINTLTNPPTVK